ncbi:MAG: methyltransferase domain-containing protein [bacterium]|nr:methyltransferase domain-containing protein [bacterium]
MLPLILLFLSLNLVILIVFLFIINKHQLKLLKKYQSNISGNIEIRQTKDKTNEIRMLMNYYTQGISTSPNSTTGSYWDKAANISLGATQNNDPPQIMTIGLGACTIPNIIANSNSNTHQTLIEIDPIVIQACNEYFKLKELPNCTLINSDIYNLIDTDKFKTSQDVIMLDILTSKSKYAISEKEQNLIKIILTWLKPNGSILFNRPSHTVQLKKDVIEFEKYLHSQFDSVKTYTVVDEKRKFENTIIQVNSKSACNS